MNSSPRYTIDLIETEDDLFALRPEWERLSEEATPKNRFLSFDWTISCWTHFCRESSKPFVLAARRAGRLVALAALRMERQFGFRVLRFMADGRSDYLGFLQSSREKDASRAILEALNAASGKWDVALLRPLCDPYTDLGPDMVPEDIGRAAIVGAAAPFLTLAADWPTMVQTGPSRVRQAVKAARRFERAGGIVERVTPERLAEAADQICDVEAHSWKIHQGAARFQSEADQRHLRQILSTLGRRGEIEVWCARLNGLAVAYMLNFVTPERICHYQGSYRQDCGKYSPGSVLQCHAIRSACELGVREYDFMLGAENYKSGWTNGERSLRYLALFPRKLRGRLAFGTLIAPRWRMRNWKAAQVAYDWWLEHTRRAGRSPLLTCTNPT